MPYRPLSPAERDFLQRMFRVPIPDNNLVTGEYYECRPPYSRTCSRPHMGLDLQWFRIENMGRTPIYSPYEGIISNINRQTGTVTTYYPCLGVTDSFAPSKSDSGESSARKDRAKY